MFFIAYDREDYRWYLHNTNELAGIVRFVPKDWIGSFEDEKRAVRHVYLLNLFNVNPLTFDLRVARERQRFTALTGIEI